MWKANGRTLTHDKSSHGLWPGELKTWFDLRSKVKVPRRSLRYVTHRLMVMHPHTKYHWLISKDKKYKKIPFKKQLFDLQVKVQGPAKVIMVCDTPLYGHARTYQISLTYLERKKLWSGQASLRSRRSGRKKISLKQYISPFVRRGDIIKIHI